MSLIILSREDWGADPNLPRRGHQLGPLNRTEIFIHHTVIVDNDSTKNEFETADEVRSDMQQLQTIRPDLGMDVPYNFVAFCMANGDLILGEGRGLNRTGAHTSGHNRSALGISFQGNFEDFPLPAQFDMHLQELSNWLKSLRLNHGFINLGTSRPADREVWAHRDVKATACPGQNLFSRLSEINYLADSTWDTPGDPILTDQDARAVIQAHGRLDQGEMTASLRMSIAVILDEIMQLKAN
jgi:hypothetical protein